MRLQKYLAQCGISSRRKCELLIKQGKVKVNGITIDMMGMDIDPEKDIISYNGHIVKKEIAKQYILFYKPRGVVTTLFDPQGRRTVVDFFRHIHERIYPVGRLDYDTEGLLILTNDGELANHLTHPKHQIDKTYTAHIHGFLRPDQLKQLENGILLEGRKTAPARVKLIKAGEDQSIVHISIHEGRNRQVRKMFDAVGHPVFYLRRDSIGSITLKNLKPGEWRCLSSTEVEYLRL